VSKSTGSPSAASAASQKCGSGTGAVDTIRARESRVPGVSVTGWGSYVKVACTANREASLGGIPECPGIVSDPGVPRHDRDQRGRFGQLFCRRQMHGIERANGFHRERASDSRQHRLGDTDEGATTRKDLEPTCRGASIGLAQPPPGNGAEDRTSGFGERQRRRDALALRAYGRPRGHVTLQQRRDQRTRLDVAG